MLKELMIAAAQVVEARLTVLVTYETILGTFAMAGELELAFLALTWQGGMLELAELPLLLAVEHLSNRLRADVA